MVTIYSIQASTKICMESWSIENSGKGQLHTCCHIVSFSSRLLYFPGFGMGTGGGGVEGDWGRIIAMNGRGLLGDGPCSCLLSSEVKGDGRVAAQPTGCQASQSLLRIWPSPWPRCQSLCLCELAIKPDAASQWPHTKVGRRRPVKLQAMKEVLARGEMLAGVYIVKPASFSL